MTSTLTRKAVTVDAKALAGAVAWAATRVQSRPTMPVYACILLESDGTTLTVSGFDEAASGSARIPVDGAPGRWLVSGRLLHALASTFPAVPLHIGEDESRLILRYGASRFALPLADLSDYPALPEAPESLGTIDAELLTRALKRIAPFVADQPGTKPNLMGVHFEAADGALHICALDIYRSGYTRLPWAGADGQVLVPGAVLQSALSHLPSLGGTLDLATSGGLFGLSGPGGSLVTNTLPYQYAAANLRAAIAKTVSSTPATVPVAELVAAVKRGQLLITEKSDPVVLRFGPDALAVLSGSESSGSDDVSCAYAGDPWEVAFNPHFLLDALATMGSTEVRLHFTAGPGNLAVQFEPVADDPKRVDPYRHVVQAIRRPGTTS